MTLTEAAPLLGVTGARMTPGGHPMTADADTPDTDPAAPQERPRADEPLDIPIVRVEVNVSAIIQMPDGLALGQNMVDATLAFGWRADDLPAGLSDAQVNAALTKAMSPVLALVQTALTFNGWVAMGQVEDPMLTESRSRVVGAGRSWPVTVRLDAPDERNTVHD